MIYLYDILANFNETLYDFYDWKTEDTILHLRKVPLFKIDTSTFIDISFNETVVDKNFLEKIYNKTQVFTARNVETINYCAVFTNDLNAVIVMFKQSGKVIKKSKMLVNEEMEVLSISAKIEKTNLEYIVEKKNKFSNMTRSEKIEINNLIESINEVKDNEEIINYLYFEWFNHLPGKNAHAHLIKDIKKSYSSKSKELLSLLNIIKVKK